MLTKLVFITIALPMEMHSCRQYRGFFVSQPKYRFFSGEMENPTNDISSTRQTYDSG